MNTPESEQAKRVRALGQEVKPIIQRIFSLAQMVYESGVEGVPALGVDLAVLAALVRDAEMFLYGAQVEPDEHLRVAALMEAVGDSLVIAARMANAIGDGATLPPGQSFLEVVGDLVDRHT